MEIIQKQIPHVYKTCLHRGIDITKTPLEVAPGSHTWLGGLKIDGNGKTPVDGLWAAGETAGGIHGGNRIGGSALAASMVFGRRAGRAAAARAHSEKRVPAEVAVPDQDRALIGEMIERTDGIPQSELNLACRMLAHEKLGPIRDAESCCAAIAEYRRIETEDIPRMRLGDDARVSEQARGLEIEGALSVRNLALLGRLLGTAALNREESRGAHFRLDFPDADNAKWRRVTRLERGPHGEIEFHTDPVKEYVSTAA
jgi:succinate dehydrogenase/fumarate reductase flavoprotein subunit